MLAHRAVVLIGLGRTLLGAVALTLPEHPSRPWIGRSEAAAPGAKVLARALGARDLALGIGALEAGARGRQLRPWALAGSGADALDALVTVANWRRLPRVGRWMVLTAAAGAAVAGLVAAAVMDSEEGGHRTGA